MKNRSYLNYMLKHLITASVISGIITAAFYNLLFDEKTFLIRAACGFFVGFFIAMFIMLYTRFDKKVIKGSFLFTILTSTLFCLLVIFFVPIFFHIIFKLMAFEFSLEFFIEYITDPSLLVGMGYGVAMTVIFLFFIEISSFIGSQTLIKFITGRYHKPREENAVVMFLDLNDSTSIAEKLGEKLYLSFINDFFRDLSDTLVLTRAEVHKYVGDEAILLWTPEKAFKNDNCYRCFFLAKDRMKSRSDYYMRKYGTVPDFKAGLHYGKVVFGEVGTLLREIACLGDVLNTAARITSECREKRKPLLISHDAASKLSVFGELEQVGEVTLRGKEQAVSLFTSGAVA